MPEERIPHAFGFVILVGYLCSVELKLQKKWCNVDLRNCLSLIQNIVIWRIFNTSVLSFMHCMDLRFFMCHQPRCTVFCSRSL